MAFYSLHLKYALEGRSNFIAWRDNVEAVSEDNGLKEFIDLNIPKQQHRSSESIWIEEARGKGEVDNPLGCLRPHFLEYPWEGNSACYVESIEGHFPE